MDSAHGLAGSARRQVALFAAAYLLYGTSRWLAIGDTGVAVDNAHGIVDLERGAGVYVEASVQDALTGSWLLWLLNHLYLAAQLVVVPAALVWLYRRSARVYLLLRNTILATWALSVPVYALFPVAPPRLAEIGMVDTITSQTGMALDSKLTTAFYNPLAAVPSLHAGFALAVGVALFMAARGPLLRLAAAAWAPVVGLAVVATGNHFFFDIAAGVAITGLGFATATAATRFVPDRGFRWNRFGLSWASGQPSTAR